MRVVIHSTWVVAVIFAMACGGGDELPDELDREDRFDSQNRPDGAPGPIGIGAPPTAIDAGPVMCFADSQCDDNVFCNGQERCDPDHPSARANGCASAASTPCAPDEVCNEAMRLCSEPIPDGGLEAGVDGGLDGGADGGSGDAGPPADAGVGSCVIDASSPRRPPLPGQCLPRCNFGGQELSQCIQQREDCSQECAGSDAGVSCDAQCWLELEECQRDALDDDVTRAVEVRRAGPDGGTSAVQLVDCAGCGTWQLFACTQDHCGTVLDTYLDCAATARLFTGDPFAFCSAQISALNECIANHETQVDSCFRGSQEGVPRCF